MDISDWHQIIFHSPVPVIPFYLCLGSSELITSVVFIGIGILIDIHSLTLKKNEGLKRPEFIFLVDLVY